MSYKSKTVSEATSQQLLWELLQRCNHSPAPRKVELYEPFRSCLVSIDKDHTAEILIPAADIPILLAEANKG